MLLCKYVSIASKLTWCAILQTQKILQFIRKNKIFLSNVLNKTPNDLKRPTTSKKRPETTLKRHITHKKLPEATYDEQEMTWNDLQRARNDLEQPRASKKIQPICKLISNFFDLILIMGVVFNSSSESLHELHEIWFSSTLSRASCNLAKLFSIFIETWWEPLLGQ